ncbi:MAG: hypothetical protein ABI151_16100, partial [Chitinophagaceae bacterium]
MEDIEYIDSFINNELSREEMRNFDRRILEEPGFAEEVAFYLSARKLAQEQSAEEKKERFRSIYKSQAPVIKTRFGKKLLPYAIAASLLITVWFTWLAGNKKSQSEKLADAYIEANLATLGINMDDQADSIQFGLKLYNEKNYTKAESAFESIVRSNPGNFAAIKYAGLAELNSGKYDKALDNFRKLAAQTSLYANPGKFYQALTLMKRKAEGDAE